MNNNGSHIELPEALNASDFMWSVVAHTPAKLRDIRGVVNVDVALRIDEHGRTEIKSIKCQTLSGKPIAENDPEIVAAARTVIGILKFAAAKQNGVPVAFEPYELSFGFTSAALENGGRKRTHGRTDFP